MVTMGEDFGTFTDGDGRTATFTGVPAGSHTVSVSGFNVNGMSVEAGAQVTVLNPVVVTPPVVIPPIVAPVVTAPSVPRTVTEVVARGGKASVSFKAPASTHGAAVTRYIVTLAGQEKWVSATTRTVSFKGLTKGTYAARVFALTRTGRSKAASVSVHVSAAKAAAAPLTLKLGMRGTTIVKLQAKLAMPSKAQSGLFNAGTRRAVMKWQKEAPQVQHRRREHSDAHVSRHLSTLHGAAALTPVRVARRFTFRDADGDGVLKLARHAWQDPLRGGGGIRTHERLPVVRFQGACHRPLGDPASVPLAPRNRC